MSGANGSKPRYSLVTASSVGGTCGRRWQAWPVADSNPDDRCVRRNDRSARRGVRLRRFDTPRLQQLALQFDWTRACATSARTPLPLEQLLERLDLLRVQ